MPRKRARGQGSVSAGPQPIAGPEAFKNHRDTSHVHSQAATLLLIGSHLRGDFPAMRARTETALRPTTSPVPPLSTEDSDTLGFPAIRPSGERFSANALTQLSTVRAPAVSGRVRRRPSPKNIPATAERFYHEPNTETAAALLHASLYHPQALVRVAAASSYVEVAVDPRPAIKVLEGGVRSKDMLVRDVAAYALANVDPKNSKLQVLLREKRLLTRRKRSRTSTIIHGTWAASGTWWQPGGDFWTYLHDNVDASLYGAADRFGWTGGYSDVARADGGTALHQWVNDHSLDGLDLYTHSHGGSVAMLANHAGTKINKLVLLSCPVHWPEYTPDFTATQKTVSVRVHLDLVILADRGGQRFSDPRVQENVLPLWFDHFATHDPGNWQKYTIPGVL
jgi:hypothetical protein